MFLPRNERTTQKTGWPVATGRQLRSLCRAGCPGRVLLSPPGGPPLIPRLLFLPSTPRELPFGAYGERVRRRSPDSLGPSIWPRHPFPGAFSKSSQVLPGLSPQDARDTLFYSSFRGVRRSPLRHWCVMSSSPLHPSCCPKTLGRLWRASGCSPSVGRIARSAVVHPERTRAGSGTCARVNSSILCVRRGHLACCAGNH